MEILIQSVLQEARRLRLKLHLRYLHAEQTAGPAAGALGRRMHLQPGSPSAMSYVIISRSYQYLEPVVRQLFRQAPDVQVLVDRRWHTRRMVHRAAAAERRSRADRRVSAPMLDILIDVGS